MKCFKLGVTNTDGNVKEELECQSDVSEVLEDTQTFQTPMISLSNPALQPKICDRRVTDHLILYGTKKVQVTNYPQGENGRHFSDSHFRKLVNNVSVPCQWLMYSEMTS
jgi:hypothetical protein